MIWREVRNADLTPEVDPLALLRDGLASIAALDAVGLMTSRDIARHFLASATVDGVTACCLATVGLGNGEVVGHRRHARPEGFGTINLLLHVDAGLTDAGLLEALSVATEARTVAVLEAGYCPGGAGSVTGTGTDCVVAACPPGGSIAYAGLHTAVGEAIGAAVLAAVRPGAGDWMAENSLLDKSAGGALS